MTHTPVTHAKSPQGVHKESPQAHPEKQSAASPSDKKQIPKVVGKKTARRSMSPPHSPPSPHEGSYTETFESSTSKLDDTLTNMKDNDRQEPSRGEWVFLTAVIYPAKTPVPGQGNLLVHPGWSDSITDQLFVNTAVLHKHHNMHGYRCVIVSAHNMHGYMCVIVSAHNMHGYRCVIVSAHNICVV